MMANNEKTVLGIILVGIIVVGVYFGYDYFLTEDVVEENDIVQVNYIAWIKDTDQVFAATIVNETNITKDTVLDDSHRYRPISITIGSGEASKGTIKVIEGLDEGLRGLKVGDIVEIEIPPEKGYEVDPEDLVEVDRLLDSFEKEQTTSRYESYSRALSLTSSEYESEFGVEPQVGDVVNISPFTGTVTDITDDVVTIVASVDVGYVIETLPWDMKVVEVTDDTIEVEYLAEVDGSYQNAYGTIRVTEITDDEIYYYQETLMEEIETIYGPADIIDLGDSFQLFINPVEGRSITSTDGTAVINNITDDTFTLDYSPAYVGNTIVYRVKVEKIIKSED